MRKLVLFLILFALGLALLLWVERTATPPQEPPPPAPVLPGVPERVEPTVVESPGGQTQVTTGGVFEHIQRDEVTLQPAYRVRARDHRGAGGGTFEFEDIEASFFDAQGERERVIEARRARGRLQTAPDVRFDENEPVELRDVVVRQLTGSPLVPLTLEVARLEARLADQRAWSSERVTVQGRGLRGSGTGLEIDAGVESLRILRDPRVELELAAGRARLQARGSLLVQSRPDLGEGGVEIRASESALLEFFRAGESGPPLQLWAESLVLEARMPQGLERFEPLRVLARERVTLAPGDGAFTGEAADLLFDAQGPSTAQLADGPRAELVLRDVDGAGGLVPGEGLQVQASGAGPLDVTLGAPGTFRFQGPLLVEAKDIGASLTARDELAGERTSDGSFTSLTARGNVVVTDPRATLRTETLHVRSTPRPDGKPASTLRAEGRTLVEGRLEDGRSYTLRAREHVVAVQDGESVRVPEARGVELSVLGADGFVASAEHVRDFVLEPLAFEAEGDVTFSGERGIARGERLQVLARDQVRLEGGDEQRASVNLLVAEITAERLGWSGEEYSADGRVEVRGRAEELDLSLDSDWLKVLREHAPGPAPDPAVVTPEPRAATFTLDAGGGVRVRARSPLERHELDAEVLHLVAATPSGELRDLELHSLSASQAVRLLTEGPGLSLHARGEQLELEQDGSGRLVPAPGKRVEIEGLLPRSQLEFRMSAASLVQSAGNLVAEQADLEVMDLDLPPAPGEARRDDPVHARASAGRITLSEDALVLSGGASLARMFPDDASWTIDAEEVRVNLTRDEPAPGEGLEPRLRGTRVLDVIASGGFFAQGGELRLRGEQLELVQATRHLTATGEPVQLFFRDLTWETTRIEIDPSSGSLRAASGSMRTLAEGAEAQVLLRYESIDTAATPDETIQVLREPVLTTGTRELRAGWALFWLDARQWSRMTSGMVRAGEAQAPEGAPGSERRAPHPQSLFGFFDMESVAAWLREAYLEGDVEIYENGERLGRADALYVDLIDGHGWVQGVDLWVELPFTSRERYIKLRAEWLRASGDGSYTADTVVATSCEFEDPHYVLRIGDISLEPRMRSRPRRPDEPPQPGPDPDVVQEPDGWSFQSKRSSVVFWRDVSMPLPRVSFPTDKDFKLRPDGAIGIGGLSLPPVNFGTDSKFGTYIGTSIGFKLAFRRFWAWLDGLLGGSPELGEIDGDTSVRASWLGSRGVMLGLENRVFGKNYWLDLNVDGLYDSGEDRGLLRVDEDDRDEFRGWLRGVGRYTLDDSEWIDMSLTWQTDPGVQAEFFEREFLRYEQRETWLNYRRAPGRQYIGVLAETQLDDHHSAILEQPSLTHAFGDSRIATLMGQPLAYSSRSQIGSFLWREGDPQYPSPFDTSLGLPAPGTPEREILRADTEQRLELPTSLGVAGLRAVPFVSGRATVWDEGLDEDDSPARLTLLAGLELSTTLWRQFADASRHEWTPVLGVRTDLASSEQDGAPFPIDRTEEPQKGTFYEVGLRSRWTHPELGSFLDAEVREVYGADQESGAPDGWLPIYTRVSWLASVLGVPYGLYHDARYDLESNETVYSRSFAAFEPIPPLELEAGYHSARDLNGDRLYTAFSGGASYRFSPKWEVEGRQTVSADGERLSSDLLLRRFGHDFVLDLEFTYTAGEGEGTSVRFKIEPLLFWRASGLGLLDRWRTEGN